MNDDDWYDDDREEYISNFERFESRKHERYTSAEPADAVLRFGKKIGVNHYECWWFDPRDIMRFWGVIRYGDERS